MKRVKFLSNSILASHEIINLGSPQGKASQATIYMFRAIGVVIVLWYMSSLFSQTFFALDRAATATLGAVEAAAVASQEKFMKP